MTKDKNVTVQLVGGLGNQLFGYFAGRYLANRLNATLNLDMSQFDKGITAHGSDIRSFAINENVIYLAPEKRFHIILAHNLLNMIAIKFPALRRLVEKITSTYSSKEIGYDPRIIEVKPGMKVRGYFQSHVYFSEVSRQPTFGNLDLKNPSIWYQSKLAEIRDIKPIILHVRRGDYAKPENNLFGMLSSEYYIEAAARLRGTFSEAKDIWVFSDEVDKARSALENKLSGSVEFIEPPHGTDPAESLMLMANGAAIAISNSTFSWWAATFNENGMVVAPTKWFKGMPDPGLLIPPHWLRIESQWD